MCDSRDLSSCNKLRVIKEDFPLTSQGRYLCSYTLRRMPRSAFLASTTLCMWQFAGTFYPKHLSVSWAGSCLVQLALVGIIPLTLCGDHLSASECVPLNGEDLKKTHAATLLLILQLKKNRKYWTCVYLEHVYFHTYLFKHLKTMQTHFEYSPVAFGQIKPLQTHWCNLSPLYARCHDIN